MRVPECEVLAGCTAARALFRQGQFFELPTVLESGAAEGCWSLTRYRAWLEQKQEFLRPAEAAAAEEAGPELPEVALSAPLPRAKPAKAPARGPALEPEPRVERPAQAQAGDDGVLVLDDEPDDLASVLEELERPRR